MVENPVHFRYAWARNPMGNVQVNSHLDIPLATQRSDTWPLEEVMVDGEMKLLDRRQVGRYYKEWDKERAIKEAEKVLSELKK